jgi:hypothetical protein
MVGGAPTQETATTLKRKIGYEDDQDEHNNGRTLKKARIEAVASGSEPMETET